MKGRILTDSEMLDVLRKQIILRAFSLGLDPNVIVVRHGASSGLTTQVERSPYIGPGVMRVRSGAPRRPEL